MHQIGTLGTRRLPKSTPKERPEVQLFSRPAWPVCGRNHCLLRINERINLAMPVLSEDDIYRTSTQYRLWSFTRESLSSLRSTTNQSAADGVRAALKSIHSQQTAGESEGQSSHDEATRPINYVKEVDCLTVEEELKLVGFYCVKTMQFADFCEFPTNVKVNLFNYSHPGTS